MSEDRRRVVGRCLWDNPWRAWGQGPEPAQALPHPVRGTGETVTPPPGGQCSSSVIGASDPETHEAQDSLDGPLPGEVLAPAAAVAGPGCGYTQPAVPDCSLPPTWNPRAQGSSRSGPWSLQSLVGQVKAEWVVEGHGGSCDPSQEWGKEGRG